jgi:hypothetical protein
MTNKFSTVWLLYKEIILFFQTNLTLSDISFQHIINQAFEMKFQSFV